MSNLEIENEILKNMDRNSPAFREAAEKFWSNPNNPPRPLVEPGPKMQAWLDEVDQRPISETDKLRVRTRALIDGTLDKLCKEDLNI